MYYLCCSYEISAKAGHVLLLFLTIKKSCFKNSLFHTYIIVNNCLLDDNIEPNFQVLDSSVSLSPASLPPPASVLEHPLVLYPPTSCPPASIPPRKEVNSGCTNCEKMKAKIEEYEREMAVFRGKF